MKLVLNFKVILSLGDILEFVECNVCFVFGSGYLIYLRIRKKY